MQLAGPVACGQGVVGQTPQAVGVDPGQWLNGVVVKARYGNGGKLYVAPVLNTVPAAWSAGATYVAGNRVLNGNNVYQCQTGGTAAGSGGPTGNGVKITDNTVVWSYVGIGILTNQNGFELGVAALAEWMLFEWSGQDQGSADATTLMIVADTTNQKYCWKAS